MCKCMFYYYLFTCQIIKVQCLGANQILCDKRMNTAKNAWGRKH